MYNERQARWHLAPAYDLTFRYSLGGEHATSVHGNGMDPGMDDIMAAAGEIGMEIQKAKRMAEEIRECIHERLGK